MLAFVLLVMQAAVRQAIHRGVLVARAAATTACLLLAAVGPVPLTGGP